MERKEFLQLCFSRLRTQTPGELKKLGEKLNNVLSKERQIIVVSSFKQLSELWSELRSELWSELRSELWSELRSELWSELWSEFWSELWSELRSELWSFWEYYESVWPVFIHEFYPELKVIKRNKKKIEVLKDLVMSGNAYLQISKKKLILIPFPTIKVDERKRLHSESGTACKWLDKEFYWIHGVKFEKKLWESIVSKKIPSQDAIKLKNAEQRIIALQYVGGERLMVDLGGKIIGEDEYGKVIELEKLLDTQSKTYRYLVALDPSKGKEVWLRTRPEISSPREAEAYSYRLDRWKIEYKPFIRT